jgi:hypothetical protein
MINAITLLHEWHRGEAALVLSCDAEAGLASGSSGS